MALTLNPRYAFVKKLIWSYGIKNARVKSHELTQYIFDMWRTHMTQIPIDHNAVKKELIKGDFRLTHLPADDSPHSILTIYQYFPWADVLETKTHFLMGFPPVFAIPEDAALLKISYAAKIPRDTLVSIDEAITEDIREIVECVCAAANIAFETKDGRWLANGKVIFAPGYWVNERLRIPKQYFYEVFGIKR